MFLFSIILNLLFSRIPTPENQHYINEVRNVAPVLMALHTRLFSPIIEELLTRGIFMNLFFIKTPLEVSYVKYFFWSFFLVLAMDYYHQFPCFLLWNGLGFSLYLLFL